MPLFPCLPYEAEPCPMCGGVLICVKSSGTPVCNCSCRRNNRCGGVALGSLCCRPTDLHLLHLSFHWVKRCEVQDLETIKDGLILTAVGRSSWPSLVSAGTSCLLPGLPCLWPRSPVSAQKHVSMISRVNLKGSRTSHPGKEWSQGKTRKTIDFLYYCSTMRILSTSGC